MTKPLSCTVYGLASTADGKIRYVGQTTKILRYRLSDHFTSARLGRVDHRSCWIRQQWKAGNKIFAFVIESHVPWNDAERRLIAWYRKHGAALTNLTSGGEGSADPSDENRERQRQRSKARGLPKKAWDLNPANKKGFKRPEESKARNAEAQRRLWLDPSYRARAAARLTGRKWSEATRAKRRATLAARTEPYWLARPVVVKGVRFESAKAAAAHFGLGGTNTISEWIKRGLGRFDDGTDSEEAMLQRAAARKPNPLHRRVVIDGVEYPTKAAAAKSVGRHFHTIDNWLKSGRARYVDASERRGTET